MTATELRIGNYVFAHNSTKTIIVDDVMNIGINRNGDSCDYWYNEIKPIPLTEEWLLKFGFKYIENYYKINLKDDNGVGDNLIIELDFNECEIETYNYRHGDMKPEASIFLNNIIHVHQLQNLYHALTGSELAK